MASFAGVSDVARGLIGIERFVESAGERSLVDVASLEAHPFGEPLDVGRRIASDAKAGARERSFDQSRDRTLALCSRDVDRAERFLRVAKPLGQVEHRLESDPHGVARPILPVGESVETRHRSPEVVILRHGGMLREKGSVLCSEAMRRSVVGQSEIWTG